MQKREGWRWAAVVAPPIVLGMVAVMVACHDSAIPSTEPDRSVLDHRIQSPAPLQERVRLTSRNSEDWVGQAHNAALTQLRGELRKSNKPDLCRKLIAFASMEARVPRGRARGEQRARAEAARAGLATSGICGKAAAITNASLPQEGITLSLTANMLANQIQISIESASDRYDLASRLNSVLDAASSLDETERTIIAATVSTAQHSFEYWGEVLPYSQPDIWSQYTDCAAALKSSGYSSDQGREVCLEGGAALISLPYQRSAFEFRTAAWSVPRVCGLRGNFKAVAGADAAGAFAGGVKVAIFGPPGIVTGALAGATAASSGQWAKSTWDLFWCAMK